jgi:hypothetical protein
VKGRRTVSLIISDCLHRSIEGEAAIPWALTAQSSDSAPFSVQDVQFQPGGEMSGLNFFSTPIAGTVRVASKGRVISTEILEELQQDETMVHALMITNHLIREGCPMTPADTKAILLCLERYLGVSDEEVDSEFEL